MILALLLTVFIIPSWIQAQSKITVGILDPIWEVPDTIVPIDVTDITSSAEASLSISEEILKTLPDSSVLAKYQNKTLELESKLDSITADLEQYDLDEVGTGLLQNNISQATTLQSAYTNLRSDLEKRTKSIQKQWYILNFLVETWEHTIKTNEELSQNELLLNRAADVLSMLKEQRFVVVNLSDQLLIHDDNLLTGKQKLEQILTQLQDALEMFQRSYLTKSYPALWEADSVFIVDYKNVLRDTFDSYKSGISGFYSYNNYRIYIHLGILIVLLIVAFSVRKNLSKREFNHDDERISTFFRVFNNPISVTLTIVIFLGFLTFPSAPTAVRDIYGFLLIIPLLVVTLQVLPKNTHQYLYVVSGLFLFAKVVDMIKYGSYPLPYFLILVVLVATLIYLVVLIINHIKTRNKSYNKRIYATELTVWISFLLILASTIANIFGYVPLSFFLFTALLVSIMSGLLIIVSVTIIEAFLKLIIMGNASEMYGSILDYGEKLILRILNLVKFIATIYWITIVLEAFLIYGPLLEWLMMILESKWVVGTVTISLKGILLFVFILFVSIWLSRFIRLLLEKEVFPRVKTGRGVPGIINLILRVIIMTTGIVLALAVLGVDFNKLTILMGALGVGIGFGLQDIINNLISGLVLVFERPIQVGDTVQFGAREGKVEEIGIRSSTIKTYDGSEVIVPNGKLISNELINLTLSDPILRIEVNLGVDYGSNPQEVIDILVMQAKLHPDVTNSPEAFAIFLGFGDFSLNFRLYAYTTEVNSRLRIRSELNLAIFQALDEAKIKIPYPIQNLNINMQDKNDITKKKEIPKKKKED